MKSLYQYIYEMTKPQMIEFIKSRIDDAPEEDVVLIYRRLKANGIDPNLFNDYVGNTLALNTKEFLRIFVDNDDFGKYVEYITYPQSMLNINDIVNPSHPLTLNFLQLSPIIDTGISFKTFKEIFKNTSKATRGPSSKSGVGNGEHIFHLFVKDAGETVNQPNDLTADGVRVEIKSDGARLTSNTHSGNPGDCLQFMEKFLENLGINKKAINPYPYGGLKSIVSGFNNIYDAIKDKIQNDNKSYDAMLDLISGSMCAYWPLGKEYTNMVKSFVSDNFFDSKHNIINNPQLLHDVFASVQMYLYSIADDIQYFLFINDKFNFITIPTTGNNALETILRCFTNGSLKCSRTMALNGGGQGKGTQIMVKL